ncbi:MAG: chemotaxis protein CheX [Polyangiales bacterium]
MLDEELATVIEDIAETLFAVPIARVCLPDDAFDASALTACVDYSGGFQGALRATLSAKLARTLATLMMHKLRGSCSEDDVRDAVGEIANIAAGNLRGLLSVDCQVSLPRVSNLVVETAPILSRAQFVLFEEPISVELRGVANARA